MIPIISNMSLPEISDHKLANGPYKKYMGQAGI